MTAAGADLIRRAREGRELAYAGDPPEPAEAERLLEIPTDWLREACAALPGLADVDLDATLARLEHDWLDHRGRLIHLEVHPAARPRATAVYVHGLGDHARRSTPLGGALADANLNAVLLDRFGHGISEGRRGDATLETDFAVVERAIAYARRRFGGPVVLIGDSLGGIVSWYLLTREPDVEAAVCHCISHPDVAHDRSLRWKAPTMRVLARVVPALRVPVDQIADYSQVALEPLTERYFSERPDRLFNFSVTVRAAASYLRFEPRIPWEQVQTPVLVTIGDEDRMVSRAHTERCLEQARPPQAELMPFAGLGHQLYLDHLHESLPPTLAWIDRVLAASATEVPG